MADSSFRLVRLGVGLTAYLFPQSGVSIGFQAQIDALNAQVSALDARVTALEAVVGTSDVYACPMSVSIGQIVYETSSDEAVDLANASNLTKSPAIGVVFQKPTPTTCIIKQLGRMSGFSGLPPDQSELFLDTTDGSFTSTAPTGSGNIVQPIGLVVGADSIEWHIDPDNYTIRA